MFIDFVTLTLFNMVAGLVLLAWYLVVGLEDSDQPSWSAAFGIVGIVAMLNGFRIAWLWPLPGSYNVAYGDLSVLFGALFVAAAWSLARGRGLLPLSVYAFFAGLAAVLVGVRVIDLKMTSMPLISGVGFILTGIAGVFAGPTLWLRSRSIRLIGALIVLLTAGIWAINGYVGYWMHLDTFSKWTPK